METPTETATETATETPTDVAEMAEVAEEPPTPSHKQSKVETTPCPVPALDADFWTGIVNTKREMDKAAKSLRYSNVVVLK